MGATLEQAHEWCKHMVSTLLGRRKTVVVNNTNAELWEMRPYIEEALKTGHAVKFAVMRELDLGTLMGRLSHHVHAFKVQQKISHIQAMMRKGGPTVKAVMESCART